MGRFSEFQMGFDNFLMERLREAEHPGIASVEFYEEPGEPGAKRPVVKCTDGSAIYLTIVQTYPMGDAKQEAVVERGPDTAITVRHRED